MSNDKSKVLFPKSNSSVFKNKISSNNKNKFLFSPSSSFKLEKNYNCEGFLNNNFDKDPLRLDFGQINFSEKKNIFELNSENKLNDANRYNIFRRLTGTLQHLWTSTREYQRPCTSP